METLARIILDLLMPGSQLMILAVLIVVFLWTGWQEWAKRHVCCFYFFFWCMPLRFCPDIWPGSWRGNIWYRCTKKMSM